MTVAWKPDPERPEIDSRGMAPRVGWVASFRGALLGTAGAYGLDPSSPARETDPLLGDPLSPEASIPVQWLWHRACLDIAINPPCESRPGSSLRSSAGIIAGKRGVFDKATNHS